MQDVFHHYFHAVGGSNIRDDRNCCNRHGRLYTGIFPALISPTIRLVPAEQGPPTAKGVLPNRSGASVGGLFCCAGGKLASMKMQFSLATLLFLIAIMAVVASICLQHRFLSQSIPRQQASSIANQASAKQCCALRSGGSLSAIVIFAISRHVRRLEIPPPH